MKKSVSTPDDHDPKIVIPRIVKDSFPTKKTQGADYQERRVVEESIYIMDSGYVSDKNVRKEVSSKSCYCGEDGASSETKRNHGDIAHKLIIDNINITAIPPPLSLFQSNKRKTSTERHQQDIDGMKSPKFSKQPGQRSGKWTEEEESFANQLVIDFERGFLDDCEKGVTLRSYLARSLNCDPMRISKKFAGRCIGKLAYENCVSSLLKEKMKSPLKQLRELYLTSREKEIMEKMGTGERCEFQNDNCNYCYSDVSGSEDGYETTGATYDRSREYYCSSSLPESQNPHMNVNSLKIDQNKHGSVLDLIDLGGGSVFVDDEWQTWQQYGVPGLLTENFNHSADGSPPSIRVNPLTF